MLQVENYFLLLIKWRHFPAKNHLIQKSKTKIVGNTKFYYRAKSQLKRLNIEKLFWKRSLFWWQLTRGVKGDHDQQTNCVYKYQK